MSKKDIQVIDAVEIAFRLKRKGLSNVKLARRFGVSESVVSNVVHNRATSWPVASRIAELLGEDIKVLFPGRYDKALSKHSAAAAGATQGKKGGAQGQ